MKFSVSDRENGWSLLAFLKMKNEGTYSAKKIKRAIDLKGCKVNGRIECFSSYTLLRGDSVELDDFFLTESKPSLSFSVLYEDAYFVVVNKPAGWVCLNEKLPPFLSRCQLVHRLDKGTSGALLLAKNDAARESAEDLFFRRAVEKLYIAVVDGKVSSTGGVIDTFLGKKGGYEGQTLYGSQKSGLRAITHWHRLSKKEDCSVLQCDLKTGRTHQIRVHLSELGHPVLGDLQYAPSGFVCKTEPKRMLLHAQEIAFVHPFTGQNIRVKAPLPSDFQEEAKKIGLLTTDL